METTLRMKMKGSVMEQIFNKSTKFILKHYQADGVNDKNYDPDKKYWYNLLIRHPEETDAKKLFQAEVSKIERPKQRKVFLVCTEKGRVKNKLSFYIAEIVPNKGLRLIDNDYTCSQQSHRGIESEAIQVLVNKNELPITAINERHYINPRVKNYTLILITGQGLNYINQIN